MEDYTDSQVAQIKHVKGAANPLHAENRSAAAELKYKELYGGRSKYIHIKTATLNVAPFHFSHKWKSFLRFKNNITVFFNEVSPIGWLYHKDIKLVTCPFDGFDLAPDCKLNSIESFNPKSAS